MKYTSAQWYLGVYWGGGGTLVVVGLSEGGGVGGGCEDSRLEHHEVPAGGLCRPCGVTKAGVVVPPAGRSGAQSLHGDRGGYSCWEFFFGIAR